MLRMMHRSGGLLILAGLAGLLWPHAGFSQSTPPADAATETLPAPSRALETPPASPTPAPLNLPSVSTPPSVNAPPSLPAPPLLPAPSADGPTWENGVLGPPGQTIGWFGT